MTAEQLQLNDYCQERNYDTIYLRSYVVQQGYDWG